MPGHNLDTTKTFISFRYYVFKFHIVPQTFRTIYVSTVTANDGKDLQQEAEPPLCHNLGRAKLGVCKTMRSIGPEQSNPTPGLKDQSLLSVHPLITNGYTAYCEQEQFHFSNNIMKFQTLNRRKLGLTTER